MLLSFSLSFGVSRKHYATSREAVWPMVFLDFVQMLQCQLKPGFYPPKPHLRCPMCDIPWCWFFFLASRCSLIGCYS